MVCFCFIYETGGITRLHINALPGMDEDDLSAEEPPPQKKKKSVGTTFVVEVMKLMLSWKSCKEEKQG